ncbi:MAG: hypothetical protein ACOC7J_06200 [Armatimonadota bacterium]
MRSSEIGEDQAARDGLVAVAREIHDAMLEEHIRERETARQRGERDVDGS